MQKLHEENEKLFDRLTEKSGLGSLPQVVPKTLFILLLFSLCGVYSFLYIYFVDTLNTFLLLRKHVCSRRFIRSLFFGHLESALPTLFLLKLLIFNGLKLNLC
jgi:hypothetical protein